MFWRGRRPSAGTWHPTQQHPSRLRRLGALRGWGSNHLRRSTSTNRGPIDHPDLRQEFPGPGRALPRRSQLSDRGGRRTRRAVQEDPRRQDDPRRPKTTQDDDLVGLTIAVKRHRSHPAMFNLTDASDPGLLVVPNSLEVRGTERVCRSRTQFFTFSGCRIEARTKFYLKSVWGGSRWRSRRRTGSLER